MKTLLKLAALAGLLAWGVAPARAGTYYDLTQNVSSASLRVGLAGINPGDSVLTSSGTFTVLSTSTVAGHIFFKAKNQAGTVVLSLTQSGALTVTSVAGDGSGLTSLNATQLLSGTIPAARIGTGDIDTSKLASDAVTNVKIINAAVDTTKLATDAVTTVKILNGAVDTNKLATDSVTAVKILNGTITAAKLSFTAGTGDVLSTSNNSFNTAATNQTFGSSVTFKGGLFGTIAVSSQAAGNNLGDNSSFTNTTFGVCRSTLVIVTNGSSPVMVYINVIARNTSANALIDWTVYTDGTPAFATTSIGGGTAFATGTDFPIVGNAIIATPAQGSHSYCLAVRVSAGTGTMNESKGFWGMYELH